MTDINPDRLDQVECRDVLDGRPFAGLLVARNFQEAEELAGASGVTVLGEYAGEIPSDLSLKETRRRLDAMRLAECQRDPSR